MLTSCPADDGNQLIAHAWDLKRSEQPNLTGSRWSFACVSSRVTTGGLLFSRLFQRSSFAFLACPGRFVSMAVLSHSQCGSMRNGKADYSEIS
jgi:hypothetical protein